MELRRIEKPTLRFANQAASPFTNLICHFTWAAWSPDPPVVWIVRSLSQCAIDGARSASLGRDRLEEFATNLARQRSSGVGDRGQFVVRSEIMVASPYRRNADDEFRRAATTCGSRSTSSCPKAGPT